MRRAYTACLLIAGLAAGPATARTLHGFQQFGSEQGLSHNSVYALAQDHQGFIWVGTVDGLNRFDGYEFRVYRHQRGRPDGLPSSLIWALTVDSDHRLWVGTAAGLARYRPAHDDFVRITAPGAPAGRIHAITERADGAICVGHQDGFHCREAGREWHAVPLELPDSARRNLAVTSAVVDADGAMHLMVSDTDYGGRWLARLGDDGIHWSRLPVDVGTGHQIGVDRHGRLWWSTQDPATAGAEVDPDSVAWAYEESEDGVWIGTADGLVQFSGEGRHVYRPGIGPNAFLRNFVRALLTDDAGELWVGTHGGLFRSRPAFRPFRQVGFRRDDRNSLGAAAVATLQGDRENRLWIGTFGGGLDLLDAQGRVHRFPHLGGAIGGDESVVIWDMTSLGPNTLLLATSHGLYAFATDLLAGRRLPVTASLGLNVNMRRVEPAREGGFWLATTAGLFRLDDAARQASRVWPSSVGGEEAPFMTVESLLVEDRVLWLGTRENDIVRLNPDGGDERSLRLADSLAGEGIWQIMRTRAGRLLLGTGAGLLALDELTWTIDVVLQPPEMPGSVVYSIAEDPNGLLWLGTNRGLIRFDPDTRETMVFEHHEGTGNTEYNRGAMAALQTGQLAFGGMDGLTLFDPLAVGRNRYQPPVVLTGVELHSHAGVARPIVHGAGPITLAPDVSTVVFEFAALDYSDPASNRFRYRMKGLEDGWVEAGARRIASYSALPRGNYVFEVMGSNSDGLWSRRRLEVPVVALPPFWQTWWFRALLALLILAAIVTLYRRRVRHLLELERVRWRIADDLHDELSSELSGIAVTADLLQRNEADPEAQHRLAAIRRTARHSVESLRDIVWYVNPDHDSGGALIERFRSLGQRLFPDREFSLHCPPSLQELKLPMGVRRNLFLIYKEALHNVLRHARANTITVSLHHTDQRLTLTVEDDGTGLDENPASDGSGLASMRRRAAEIGAILAVEPASPSGTRVRVVLDLARIRDGRSTSNESRLSS